LRGRLARSRGVLAGAPARGAGAGGAPRRAQHHPSRPEPLGGGVGDARARRPARRISLPTRFPQPAFGRRALPLRVAGGNLPPRPEPRLRVAQRGDGGPSRRRACHPAPRRGGVEPPPWAPTTWRRTCWGRCAPASSWSASPARTASGLWPEDVLEWGMRNGAAALGWGGEVGSLEVGKKD